MPRTASCATCFYYDWHSEDVTLGTVTISIATPGVVTATGLAGSLATNQPVVFATTGALPTGLSTLTAYYVIPVDANTFKVAATPGGAAINTSGSQSGTQSCQLVVMGCHFNAPRADQSPSQKTTWRPVDPTYWCGEGADATSGQSFSSNVVQLPAPQAVSSSAWLSFTPVVTPNAGSLTSVTPSCRYIVLGKLIVFTMNIIITTNGTGSGYLIATVPVSPGVMPSCSFAAIRSNDFASVSCILSAGQLLLFKYDGTYPGVDGTTITVSGTYQSA
jgi:hypothetical protein